MTQRGKFRSFFEQVPLEYAGLIVAGFALIVNQVEFEAFGHDIPFISSVALVFLIMGLFIGKHKIPTISVIFSQPNHEEHLELKEREIIDASSGKAEIDMRFNVPSHYNDLYLSFELEGYIIGVDQYEPVNYDMDEAITYYSNIRNFELTLNITEESKRTNQGSTRPLVIKDKLNDRVVEEIPVKN